MGLIAQRVSYIERKAMCQLYPSAEQPAGTGFYKLSVVESLVRMTGWLTGKKEIATIQMLMTNVNITRNRPQSLGRLT